MWLLEIIVEAVLTWLLCGGWDPDRPTKKRW